MHSSSSWFSRLQVGASFAGGGAWTPVSHAGDSLAGQEGTVPSTRRRKSAALGSPTGGARRLAAGARVPSQRWDKWKGGSPDEEEGHPGLGQPRQEWRRPKERPTPPPPGSSTGVSAHPPGAPRSARVSGRAKERHRGEGRLRPPAAGFRASEAGQLSLRLSVSQPRAGLRLRQAALRAPR